PSRVDIPHKSTRLTRLMGHPSQYETLPTRPDLKQWRKPNCILFTQATPLSLAKVKFHREINVMVASFGCEDREKPSRFKTLQWFVPRHAERTTPAPSRWHHALQRSRDANGRSVVEARG